jgi:hypothetical protein
MGGDAFDSVGVLRKIVANGGNKIIVLHWQIDLGNHWQIDLGNTFDAVHQNVGHRSGTFAGKEAEHSCSRSCF